MTAEVVQCNRCGGFGYITVWRRCGPDPDDVEQDMSECEACPLPATALGEAQLRDLPF